MGIPKHLTCLLRNCVQVKKQQLELDMEQQTGSKSGKKYTKAIYCHPVYLAYMQSSVQLSSVQSLSRVWLFVITWTAARQAFLSITNSWSLLKLMSIESWCHPTTSSSVIAIFFHLQSFPASESFPMNQFFTSGGQSIGVSASASVLPMNIQGWFPLGWNGWISLLSRGPSRVFSNTTVQTHQFFVTQLSL